MENKRVYVKRNLDIEKAEPIKKDVELTEEQKEKKRAYAREYAKIRYQEKKETMKASCKKYREKNLEKIKQNDLNYYYTHKEKFADRLKERNEKLKMVKNIDSDKLKELIRNI